MRGSPREYRHKVTVERLDPNATGDVNGVVNESDDDNWIRYCDRWAAIFNRGGREVWRAQQVHASATALVRMPYDSMVAKANTKMRIRSGDRTLNIISISDVDSSRYELEIICEEDLE